MKSEYTAGSNNYAEHCKEKKRGKQGRGNIIT